MGSKPKAFMVRTGVVPTDSQMGVCCAHEYQVNMYKFWGFIICDVCDLIVQIVFQTAQRYIIRKVSFFFLLFALKTVCS